MRPLLFLALVAVIAFSAGRVTAIEDARADSRAGNAEFGYGMIRYGGKGPEAWRWEKLQADRRADQLQRRLAARVRQVRRLQAVVGRSFIPDYWVAIASCESGVDWDYNGSSGFDGAVQFHPGTWSSYRLPGYPAFAWQASPFQQLVIAELVLARQGWGAWPACSRKVGLR
jgi:hypothetical protein